MSERCPVCGRIYDSLSIHESGLMVNLLRNERYRRVCFEPAERAGRPVVRFYHHTHEQVRLDDDSGVSKQYSANRKKRLNDCS